MPCVAPSPLQAAAENGAAAPRLCSAAVVNQLQPTCGGPPRRAAAVATLCTHRLTPLGCSRKASFAARDPTRFPAGERSERWHWLSSFLPSRGPSFHHKRHYGSAYGLQLLSGAPVTPNLTQRRAVLAGIWDGNPPRATTGGTRLLSRATLCVCLCLCVYSRVGASYVY